MKDLEIDTSEENYKDRKIHYTEYIHKNGTSYLEDLIIRCVSIWRKRGGLGVLYSSKLLIEALIEIEEGLIDIEKIEKRNPLMKNLEIKTSDSHYKEMEIEPIDYIYKNKIPYLEGCIIKYVSVWRNRNSIGDLYMAKTFLEELIKLEGRKLI